MIGFRNLLVHDYGVINLKLEYEFIKEHLPDFEKYMKHIATWLKAQK